MEEVINKYNIHKDKSGLYRLNDIVNNMVKSKNPNNYMDRIKNKKRNKNNNYFYIDKDQFIAILKKSRTTICKEALKILLPDEPVFRENLQSEAITIIDIKNNNFLFEGNKIIVMNVNNEIWFKGKDIATILEYQNTNKAIITHLNKDDHNNFDNLRKKSGFNKGNIIGKNIQKNTIFINRNGLESLIIKSNKPKSIELANFFKIDVCKKYPIKECEILNNIRSYLDEKNIETTDAYILMLSDDDNYKITELIYENIGTKDVIVRLNKRENFEKFQYFY
jgi:hypothetical protein